MPSITSYLTTEHAVLAALFDEVERIMPEAQSAGEVNRLAQMVEAVLNRHARIESDLAFSALDQQLAQQGELQQLHQDHKEIDAHLLNAKTAKNLAEAIRLLRTAIETSRVHFRREERNVFPLFEKLFQPETLEALGFPTVQAYLAQRRAAKSAKPATA
jgi:hemerythrin-like domain-containing protein